MSRRTPHPCAVYVFLHNVQSGAVICGSRNEAHKREMNGHKAPCAESRRDVREGSLTRRDPKCVKQFNGPLSGCEFCPLQRAHSGHAVDSPSPPPHPFTPPFPFFFISSNFISRTFNRRSPTCCSRDRTNRDTIGTREYRGRDETKTFGGRDRHKTKTVFQKEITAKQNKWPASFCFVCLFFFFYWTFLLRKWTSNLLLSARFSFNNLLNFVALQAILNN